MWSRYGQVRTYARYLPRRTYTMYLHNASSRVIRCRDFASDERSVDGKTIWRDFAGLLGSARDKNLQLADSGWHR